MTLRRLVALRPGPLISTLASAKTSLRAIARRWLLLDAEIKQHDAHLEILTVARAPELLEAHGMASGTAAEMLLLVGDNPKRIHSRQHSPSCAGHAQSRHQAARPSGTASTEEAIGRQMLPSIGGSHHPYARSPADIGLRPADAPPRKASRSEIIRCLKRYVAREIFGYLCTSRGSRY